MSSPRIRALFFESGRRGGSINRLKSILERLDPDRFEAGFLSWYHDLAAARLFGVERAFCRASLRLRGLQPDTLKHPFGLSVPTPFALYYYLVSRRIISRHRPHVAYMNTGITSHVPAILAAHRLGVPVVCHVRDSRPRDRYERTAARRITRIVASTRWGARRLQDELGRSPADVDSVYEGIDLASFDIRSSETTTFDPSPGSVHVCLVGSLIERKRPLLAIEALAMARRRLPDIRLVVAGDGPLRGAVERAVHALGLDSVVARPGNVAALPALLRRCDVGLLVSESEGMPNVVMEYMAASLPVVTSSVPGVNELVEEGRTGFIIPDPATPAKVSEALVALARDADQRRSFGSAARKVIEREEFGVEAEARGVGAVLLKAVACDSPRLEGQPVDTRERRN